jgi:hypothetical protein
MRSVPSVAANPNDTLACQYTISSIRRHNRLSETNPREQFDRDVKGAHDIIVASISGFERIQDGNFLAFNIIAGLAPELTSATANKNNRKNCLVRAKRRTNKLAADNHFVATLTDAQILAVADAVAQRRDHIESHVENLLAMSGNMNQVSEKDINNEREEHIRQLTTECNTALKIMFHLRAQ